MTLHNPIRTSGRNTSVRIGLDFDNTLADYDGLFATLALEEGLLPGHGPASKRDIRDRVRALPNGESEWQRLQAIAYGPRMSEARLMPGAARFLDLAQRYGIELTIVSHKSRRAAYQGVTDDLREAASQWMTARGFGAYGLTPDRVHFEDSRAAKVERIHELALTHFVDDLEEVFRHPDFPPDVSGILFDPRGTAAPGAFRRCATWDEIAQATLGAVHAY